MNLAQLRILLAFLAVILVVTALVMYGLSWDAVKLVGGAPLAVVALGGGIALTMGTVALVMQGRGALRVRHAISLARAGSPDAERVARDLDTRWGVEERLAKRAGELAPLLTDPPPTRFAALRLLTSCMNRHETDVDAALIAGATDWPEDLFEPIWRLARTEATRFALARVFLARAAATNRPPFLAVMFASYSPRVVPPPTPQWRDLLAPYEAEIRTLSGFAVDAARVAEYVAAFDAATRAG